MNIIVSGKPLPRRPRKQLREDFDQLWVEEQAFVECRGDVGIVRADTYGSVIVRGQVTKKAMADNYGSIFCHGNPRTVVANNQAEVIVAGNPRGIVASREGRVFIFGEPQHLIACGGGVIAVASLASEYRPLTQTAVAAPDDEGNIRTGAIEIFTPEEGRETPLRGVLAVCLRYVFPLQEPPYADYLKML